jgi:hypothetical protein
LAGAATASTAAAILFGDILEDVTELDKIAADDISSDEAVLDSTVLDVIIVLVEFVDAVPHPLNVVNSTSRDNNELIDPFLIFILLFKILRNIIMLYSE